MGLLDIDIVKKSFVHGMKMLIRFQSIFSARGGSSDRIGGRGEPPGGKNWITRFIFYYDFK